MEWDRVIEFVRFDSGRFVFRDNERYLHELPVPPVGQPLVYCDPAWPDHGAALSTAAWLRDGIGEHGELTAAWQASDEYADVDRGWFASAAAFMERYGYVLSASGNTCNEITDFDQGYVWEVWERKDAVSSDWLYNRDAVVLLYVHTGSEVESGYAPPILSRPMPGAEYVFPFEPTVCYQIEADGWDPERTLSDVEAAHGPVRSAEMREGMAVFVCTDGTEAVGDYLGFDW
jgi:hypothetical protein